MSNKKSNQTELLRQHAELVRQASILEEQLYNSLQDELNDHLADSIKLLESPPAITNDPTALLVQQQGILLNHIKAHQNAINPDIAHKLQTNIYRMQLAANQLQLAAVHYTQLYTKK
jgi:hypothetical protein